MIEMYFADHAPPHFHVRYSGAEATIVIDSGVVLAGSLALRAHGLVRDWLDEHSSEIEINWHRPRRREPFAPIARPT